MRTIFSILLSVFLIFIPSAIFSQIETGKTAPTVVEKEKKPKKEKKIKEKKIKEKKAVLNASDSSDRTLISFGAGFMFSAPIYSETDNLFSRPLDLEKLEKPLIVPVASINYKVGIGHGLYLGFGLEYGQTGERFAWSSNDTDSSYRYKNVHHIVGVPLSINYIVGQKVQFVGGIGIAPNLTFGSNKQVTYVTENKVEHFTKIPLSNHTNDFNLTGFVQTGVQFKLIDGLYLYVVPEVRYAFLNTLNKQAPYARKYWMTGVQMGFSLSL